jgi:hypothetical protein
MSPKATNQPRWTPSPPVSSMSSSRCSNWFRFVVPGEEAFSACWPAISSSREDCAEAGAAATQIAKAANARRSARGKRVRY